ncbi:hypothetical protein [Pelagicoccus sp. SDUM812003]|uniref:hypothetical protein n=1 Tax=Pelagicoccus sp. SDUM812003 TaxID=3041267 RepID=UPI0028108EB3|nr:hypothetical protein [Pelagicoccus sp. SDUM812003]MDQ8204808.1 hypothetical protein [Pelagicoccus sp. SDUM812003]
MDWLFDNLGKLAPLAIFVFYLISALRSRGEEEEEQDPEAAERARRIQEEIRRKILERQQKGGEKEGQSTGRPEPAEQWEPEPYDPFVPERPVHERLAERRQREAQERRAAEELRRREERSEAERPVRPEPVFQAAEEAVSSIDSLEDEYEKQRRQIQDKLEQAKRLRAQAQEKSKAAGRRDVWRREVALPVSTLRGQLAQDLKGADSLKKAIVLKEILDTPVGLR